jgi:tetratricopeptide (TPR) repeat protein
VKNLIQVEVAMLFAFFLFGYLGKSTAGEFTNVGVGSVQHVQFHLENFEDYINRGDERYKNGDFSGALTDYKKAIQLNPKLATGNHMPNSAGSSISNDIANEVTAFLSANDYAKLDGLAEQLRVSKEQYVDGIWKLSCVYDGLLLSNNASDDEWDKWLFAIERWTLAKPSSITARIALANYLVAYAWKARGGGEADTVSRTGWQLFRQRLVEAVKILKDAKALDEKCPHYWRVLQRAALGMQLDRMHFDEIFNQALKMEPKYESYYAGRAIYLLPQWYGKPGEWGSDLAASADKISGESGDILYAQVVWNMDERYDMDFFLNDNLNWERVNKGFAAIEKRYPDALEAKIERAKLAIVAQNSVLIGYYNSGNEKRDKGDLAGAIADFTKAVEKPNRDDFRAYYNRGNIKSSMCDIKGALADYNQAIEINPNYALAYYGRGMIEQTKSNFALALADYTKAVDINPRFQAAFFARGNVKMISGDKNGAASDFKKANELQINSR